MNNRDDFSQKTKDLLANRVGRRCSNPNCRKLTCAANSDPTGIVNIGVAAHICAAAAGGPRYDNLMSKEERKSFDNGIWLCQSCAKLIDSDSNRYTKDVLKMWKNVSEELALLEVESLSPAVSLQDDRDIIEFFAKCFDRPAFQDDIRQEGNMEDLDKAIEDTIIAINTGVLRTRDGNVLKEGKGKSDIKNPIWRNKIENIVDMLLSIRRRLQIAYDDKSYTKHNNGYHTFYCFCDRELGEWFNNTRIEILKVFSSVCKEAGVNMIHFRNRHYDW